MFYNNKIICFNINLIFLSGLSNQRLKSKRELAFSNGIHPTKFHIEYLFIYIRLQHCVFGSIWFSKGKKQFIGCQVKPHVLRTLTTVVCSCLGLYNASIVKYFSCEVYVSICFKPCQTFQTYLSLLK